MDSLNEIKNRAISMILDESETMADLMKVTEWGEGKYYVSLSVVVDENKLQIAKEKAA